MTRKCWLIIFAILALLLLLALTAQAAPIGRFLKLEGQVDLLKHGKLPAKAARITDPLEPGDVIRTKSKSRAQVLFIDDSVLTLAPESRVAVADFVYGGAQGPRRVLLQLFRGLAHTVVKRIMELQGPDFIMHTQTAVIGVRGTEWYALDLPNRTNVYNIEGLIELKSSNPQIIGSILLRTLEYREVFRDQPPGPARNITPAILSMLRRMMYTGPSEPPPAFSGGTGSLPDVEQFKTPEVVSPPYAPTLPAPPHKAPAPSYP
jgi:hypothetical protein